MVKPDKTEESVTVNGRQYRAIREGLAQILAPYRQKSSSGDNEAVHKKAHNNDEGEQAVFYNPIQQYNRDLSVLAILTYGEGAIAEKQSRGAKREKGKKDRPSKKKGKGGKSTTEGLAEASDLSKKRKADDDDDDELEIQRTNGSSKKPKTVKEHTNEEEGRETQQPEADDEVDIITATATTSAAPVRSELTDTKSITEPSKKRTPFTILDALSASGLRAVRYAKEIPFTTNVIANDLSAEAVKSIELNIDHNELRGKVHSNVGDARAYMYSKVGNEHRTPPSGYVHRFDVIDLDPYGTAAPFLDAAVQALADGGLLCVTCTDAGVFASHGYPEKAYSLYGGVTMKGSFSHEAGLRLILHAIAASAAKYGIAIEPLLSLSIDFYARLFVRLHKQPQRVKTLAGTSMVTYNCDFGCGAWTTQLLARNQEKLDKTGQTFFKHTYAQAPSTTPLCEHCGNKMHLGGPMWAGPLHNPYFIQRILDKLPEVDKETYQTTDRIRGMLTVALEEDLTLATSNAPTTSESGSVSTSATTDVRLIPQLPPQMVDTSPFFFVPNTLAKVLHCVTPPEDHLRGAIRYLGYTVTRSHCKAGSFKTNAPWDVLWEVMREWIRQHAPIKEGKITKGMPGWRILQKVRGMESKHAMDVYESIKQALDRGIDGKEDLKSLLESGLYRLEHIKAPVSEDVNEENAKAAQDKTSGDTGGQPLKPAWNEPRDLSKLKIVFDTELGKEKSRGKLVRYQINPRANWGPMNRAG